MSTIIADNLTGKTSAGSITVTSEGGAATQSLQQGLAKAWANYNAFTNTINGNLNASSITDNGVGDHSTSYSSAMNNDDYSLLTGPASSGTTGALSKVISQTTSDCRFFIYTGSNVGSDQTNFSFGVLGDLA